MRKILFILLIRPTRSEDVCWLGDQCCRWKWFRTRSHIGFRSCVSKLSTNHIQRTDIFVVSHVLRGLSRNSHSHDKRVDKKTGEVKRNNILNFHARAACILQIALTDKTTRLCTIMWWYIRIMKPHNLQFLTIWCERTRFSLKLS